MNSPLSLPVAAPLVTAAAEQAVDLPDAVPTDAASSAASVTLSAAAPKRPLAIVTGASSGIGLELARVAGRNGFDLLVTADEAAIDHAAEALRAQGADVTALQADLATSAGVDALAAAASGRAVDVLFANAGQGLGHAFLDQDIADVRRVIDTNITGTLDLIQRVGSLMRARGEGRIRITGSIAGFLPGSF